MRKGQLRIVNPCHEDVSKMRGPAQRKFCDSCQKHVHDLSSMTEAAATKLLEQRGQERICVRYRYGADGRIKFRPTPRTAAFVAVLSLAMAACTGYTEPDSLEHPEAAVMCRDASGYAIDCDLVDEGFIPDQLEAAQPSEPLETVMEQTAEQGVVAPERELMGDIADLPVLEGVGDVESCPLPEPDEHELMGDVVPVSETRRDRRRWRREDRRERRRARRRGTTMGRVDPL